MEIICITRTVLSIINITILVLLIYLYIKRYLKVRSEFTLGFALFSVALLFRTVFSSPMIRFFVFGDPHSSIIDPYRLIADVFELSALIILLYMTTK